MHANCPSERNLEIYAQVTYAQRSWREVAEEFDVSPARVGQIVSQVGAWQVANAPSCITSEHRQKQLVVSYQTHVARMEHWIGSSMQKANELLTKEETSKTAQATRLLACAMRMSREQMNAAYVMCKATLVSEETATAELDAPPVGGLAQNVEVAAEPSEPTAVTASGTSVSDDGTNAAAVLEGVFGPWRATEKSPFASSRETSTLTRQQRKRLRREEYATRLREESSNQNRTPSKQDQGTLINTNLR